MKSVEYINCIILKVRGRLTSWRRNNFFSNIIHESLNTSDGNTSVDLIIVALPARSIEYRTQYVYTMHNHILKHFTHHWNSLLPTDHTIWWFFFKFIKPPAAQLIYMSFPMEGFYLRYKCSIRDLTNCNNKFHVNSLQTREMSNILYRSMTDH